MAARSMSKLLILIAALGIAKCELEKSETSNDDECEDKCYAKLQEVEIIPDFADFETYGDLEVVYGGNTSVECGNKVSVLATVKAPVVTYDIEDECTRASIIMFDPDVPIISGFLHWFVANIPTKVLKKGFDGNAGRVYSEYFPPATVTGDHRYTFCVYCQRRWILTKTNSVLQRSCFNPRTYAKKLNLNSPEACNFMYTVALPGVQPDLLDKAPALL